MVSMHRVAQALAAASTEALEPRSGEWVPLLLAYLGSRSPQVSPEEAAPGGTGGAQAEDADADRRRRGAEAGLSGRSRTSVGARCASQPPR